MTQNNPTRRPVSRAATAVAALGSAASIAVAAPGAANAAIAIPEVPEWVTQILPTPDQVKDGSASYAEFIQWLGSDDVQGALKGWNSIAGAVPGGLLPGISSETKCTNGRDEQPAGAKPGSMHFKTLFERADMKGFYDLLGKDNVGMLNIAEVLGRNKGTILDRYENVITIDGLLFGGTTRLANSYAWMPGFKVLGNEIPEFSIWIPEAQGDYTEASSAADSASTTRCPPWRCRASARSRSRTPPATSPPRSASAAAATTSRRCCPSSARTARWAWCSPPSAAR